MTLLDKFRAPSRDKHPDPLVRLAWVQELPLTEHEAILAAAENDGDARVRKAAVAKLMVPSVLGAIAGRDGDETVRAQATAMLRDIALESFEGIGDAESLAALAALAALDDARLVAQVAKSSTNESIARQALESVSEGRLLGSIARHAALEPIRVAAADTLKGRDDHDELMAIALNGEFKDAALVAMDALTSRDDLETIVARGKNKSAVKRARGIIRDADEQAAREAAAAEELARLAAEEAAERAAQAAAHAAAEAAREATLAAEAEANAEVAIEEADAEADRERRAAEEAEARARAEQEAEVRRVRIGALLDEIAAAPADESFADARRRVDDLRREWQALGATGVEVDAALVERYGVIDQAMTVREREHQEADARARRDALGRLQQLAVRAESLVEKSELTLKAGSRVLRDLRAVVGSALPPLPSRQDADEISKRLKDAQNKLIPKVQELRDADDWKRFANVSVQEQLSARMEALKNTEDLEAAAREVHELQQQWRAAADVPRAQADALWRRFKTAHDEVWAKCEAYFAVQAQARAENLTKKVSLCERVEALADSTDWIHTAEEIKTLQAEWKAIGPVSRGKEKAIWDRFRTACDRFFTRRHDDLAARKTTWTENLTKKEALCVRAEELAESTEWDAAAAELKALQVQWKAIGPVKKSKSEAIWQRFRGASDKFFSRYALRHDTARAERAASREAIAVELETIGTADAQPDTLLADVRAIRSRWQQAVAGRGLDLDTAKALDHRFDAALSALVAKWPSAFAGTDLDPETNQKRFETLVQRMEQLAGSMAGARAAEAALSPSAKLASMLKEALAANTIGAKADDDSRMRAAAEEVRQAQQLLSRLGPMPNDIRRPLADRFHRAVKTINESTATLRHSR
ncbi:MAG: DUF349 domain-containing protein [Acidobacteriaceae bacterium]|jgi:hypothetical protein|nr:DUF349 domain-containing protein [Acidobacteriaceae bacterium]